ncbi:MAG: 50S ribosomal protein L6 [Clostridia bacterium]|nr:50S ribosomal protein L6 [Clostridia bacterium]
MAKIEKESRIGKLPITLPAGVTVEYKDGVCTVKGPKGQLSQQITGNIDIKVEGSECKVIRCADTREDMALHGLYRALVNNMVTGVTTGFEKKLKIAGMGWKSEAANGKLTLHVGYSHPVVFEAPKGISIVCETPTLIKISGIDKAAVGQVAADIRKVRKPEPYHGFGISYEDEIIQRKEGKTGAKGKK